MSTQKAFQSVLAPTKLLSIDIDSITAGQERVLTFPDQNLDFGISGLTTVTPATGDFVAIYDATDGLVKKVDALNFMAANALEFKGDWDASGGTFPGGGTAQVGDLYVVTVAGTVDGVSFAVGDELYARANNASTGTYASNWVKVDSTDSVTSVHGRVGSVVAVAGDYTATQITNTPAGGISSTTVQAAINELDTEKLGTTLASAQIYVGNGSSVATAVALSGDATISNTGVLTVTSASDTAAGKVELATAAEVLTGTDTARATTAAGVSSYITSLVGNATGTANLGTFTGTTIADGSSVKAALQALETAVEAAGTTSLANGTIYVGNASNVATSVAMTGDVTITNAGVTTVASASATTAGKVELATNAEVATGTDTARAVTPAGIAANYTLTTTMAGTGASQGASLVGVQDTGAFYTATTVEGVLAEIAGKILSGTAPDWTISNPGATRTFDANAVTLQQVAQAFALLVNDLITRGVIQ